MRKHYTPAQRAALVELVETGRASLGAAAAQLGLPESTAYYWLTQARRAAPTYARRGLARPDERAPRFARLVRAGEARTLTVRVAGAAIDVRPGFDAALLREVVAALAEATP